MKLSVKPIQLRCAECKSRRNLVQFSAEVFGYEALSVLCEQHYMKYLEASLLRFMMDISADKKPLSGKEKKIFKAEGM